MYHFFRQISSISQLFIQRTFNFFKIHKSMFQLTDVGTDISAPTSVIAAVIPFSLFTAYQFLSSDRRFDAPESKMRPHPSCVYRRVSALMMEMIATSFFFVYCVSNFEFGFYFQGASHTAITDAVYCVKLVASDRRVANNVQQIIRKMT